MKQLWQDMMNILKAPLVGQLDTVHLFWLVGLVLVLIAAWLMIYKDLLSGAKEIVE